MTAAALEKEVLYDEKGEPRSVVIPIDQYIELVETYGMDLSEEEEKQLREALDDSQAGNAEAFVPLEEL